MLAPGPLLFLADCKLRLQRLTSIRSLRLDAPYYVRPGEDLDDIDVEGYFKNWRRSWQIVAFEMELRELWVKIGFNGKREECTLENALFLNMGKVRGLESVEIKVELLRPAEKMEELGGETVRIMKLPRE